MPAGRPTKYRDRVAMMICVKLSLGWSLNAICKSKLYPSKSTVFKWLSENREFSDMYRAAREMQQESYLDEIIEISDDASNDYFTKTGKDGSEYEALNSEHIQRSKLRVDTRKWVMERMAPRKYMPQSKVDHTTSDGSMSPKSFSSEQYKAAELGLSKDIGDLD